MKLFFFVFATILSYSAFTQSLLPIFGVIKDLDSGRKLTGVKVTVYDGATVVKSVNTASNGKYDIKVPINKKYKVLYTKSGYVSKMVIIDVAGINEEDLPPGELPQPAVDLDLFTDRPAIDFSFTNTEPVATFFFDNKSFRMDYKRSEASLMKKKIDKLLASAEVKDKENDAKYNELISKADKAFNEEGYEQAQKDYTAALKIKPSEPHPSNRLVEIDDLLAAKQKEELVAQQADQAYQNLITAGDNFKNTKEYDKALAKYKEAAVKKPSEQLPKDKITEVNALQKALASKAEYDALIKQADSFVKQNSLKAARDKYTAASKLDASQQYPKDQLKKIEEGLKALEEIAAKKEKYNEAIASGDKLIAEGKLLEAKVKFEEALNYQSAATYPRAKITEIDDKLKEKEAATARQTRYDNLIKEADVKMAEKSYKEAIAKYKEAANVKSDETYPNTQIEKANAKIKEAANLAEQEAIDNQFNQLKTQADALFTANKLEESRLKYEQALSIKNDSEVSEKIKEIRDKLAEAEANRGKTEQIKTLFAEGNKNMLTENFEEALKNYQDILNLDAENQQAKAKIEAAKLAKANKAEQVAKDAQFEKLKNAGLALFGQQKLEDAKAKLLEAQAIKEDATVNAKLLKIEAQLASQQNTAEKEEKYTAAITAAKVFESDKNLTKAIEKYKEALVYKENDATATNKIKDLQLALAKQNQAANTEKQYTDAMKAGNEAFGDKDYTTALTQFKNALAVKLGDDSAKVKIKETEEAIESNRKSAEIEAQYTDLMERAKSKVDQNDSEAALNLYQQAIVLKPGDLTAQKAIDAIYELNELRKNREEDTRDRVKIDADYQTKITQASVAAQSKNYDNAIELYKEAQALKPNETLPQTQIEKIQAILDKKNEAQRAIEKYNSIIAKADDAFNSKEYARSISLYQNALALKDEAYAKNQIDKAKKALAILESKTENQQYNEAITTANNAFAQERYMDAIDSYKRALTVKAGDKIATDKIKEAQQILDNIKAQEETAKANKAKYDALIKSADKMFDEEKYVGAKKKYEEVLVLFPNDTYANRRLTQSIENSKRAASGAENKQYQKIIDKADQYFKEEDWEKAIKLYNRALTFRSYDSYPVRRLEEINRIKNGTIVEKSGLEDLGESEDISIMEGAALLADAERKRSQLKKQGVTDQLDIKKEKTAELNYNDDEERQSMSEEAIEAQKLKSLESLEGEARRQSIVTSVDDKQEEMSKKTREENVFERGEILRLAQDIDLIDNEISAERGREANTYKDKAEAVRTVDTDMTEFHKDELEVDASRTQAMYDDITAEIKKISTSDDVAVEYAEIQAIQKSAQLAEIEMYENAQEKQVIMEALDNDVKLLRGEAVRKSAEETEANNRAALEMDEAMAESRETIKEYYVKSDDNRKATVETVERKELELDAAKRKATEKENQEIINNELTIEQTKAVIAEKKKDDTAELLALQEEVVKARETVSKSSQVKQEAEQSERENTFQTIESTEQLRTKISVEQAKQAVENNEAVKASTNSIDRDKDVKTELNKKKALETQKIIDGFETNTAKYDETVANTLGEDFPEGVSQETFVRKDDQDLPVKVVTRRIVVTKGRGEVYIRTQTKFGITYTKNGNPITKQSWINDTENAKLVKNY